MADRMSGSFHSNARSLAGPGCIRSVIITGNSQNTGAAEDSAGALWDLCRVWFPLLGLRSAEWPNLEPVAAWPFGFLPELFACEDGGGFSGLTRGFFGVVVADFELPGVKAVSLPPLEAWELELPPFPRPWLLFLVRLIRVEVQDFDPEDGELARATRGVFFCPCAAILDGTGREAGSSGRPELLCLGRPLFALVDFVFCPGSGEEDWLDPAVEPLGLPLSPGPDRPPLAWVGFLTFGGL